VEEKRKPPGQRELIKELGQREFQESNATNNKGRVSPTPLRIRNPSRKEQEAFHSPNV
jgi:hypothetical protein